MISSYQAIKQHKWLDILYKAIKTGDCSVDLRKRFGVFEGE